MSALAEPAPIREVGAVTLDQFDRDIRAAGQPVVLRGIAREWPAVQAAMRSDEEGIAYLKRLATSRKVAAIVGQPEIGGRFFYNDDVTALNFQRVSSPLQPFLDRLLRDRDHPAPIAMAVQSEELPDLLPGFVEQNRTSLVRSDVVPRGWIGNRIRVAPHYDLYENIGIVVIGRRRFTLFPPDQLPNLYPGPFELTPAGTPVSMVDLEAPDLARYPRFAEAAKAAQSATLQPGDAIYIPYHWWHAVDSLEPVNFFVNYWWSDANRDLGRPYDALMYAFFALKHLPPEQRAVWRAVFDHYIFEVDGDPAEHLPVHARGVLGAPMPELLARMRATLRKILAHL